MTETISRKKYTRTDAISQSVGAFPAEAKWRLELFEQLVQFRVMNTCSICNNNSNNIKIYYRTNSCDAMSQKLPYVCYMTLKYFADESK